MTTPSLTHDVAVVGGGIAGTSLALGLARQGYRVACVDQTDPAQLRQRSNDIRTTAIAAGPRRLLQWLGVWDELAADACAITDIRITDQASRGRVHFDHHAVGDDPFGHILENHRLRGVMLDALAEADHVTHLAPADVVGLALRGERAEISLKDGRRLTASLVVGADGRNSTIRELAGIGVREIDYGQTAIVTVIRHEEPHQGIALEHFRISGPLATLPMTDDADGRHRSAVVWTESRRDAEAYLGLSDARFDQELQDRIGGWLGRVTAIGGRAGYPLGLKVARRMTAPRVALVADAGHGIHPIAGQGLNLGLRDIALLMELLTESGRVGQDPGAPALLAHYQRRRMTDIAAMVGFTDGMNRLFATGNPLVAGMRGLGLGMVSALPPVKGFFMRAAMGITPGAPKLTLGKPL